MDKFNRGTVSGGVVKSAHTYQPELKKLGDEVYCLSVCDGDMAMAHLTADELFELAMEMLRDYHRMTAVEE